MQDLKTTTNGSPAADAIESPLTKKHLSRAAEDDLRLSKKEREFYNALGDIQAELEDLRSILDNIRRGQTVVLTYAEYIKTTKENLESLMAGFIIDTEPPEWLENSGHTLRHICNAWEQVRSSPVIQNPSSCINTAETGNSFQEQLHFLDMLDEQIRNFHFHVSLLTIPHQVNEWLKVTGPGYYIPFHEVFANDLPNSDDRDRVLRYIAQTPHITPYGFVDIDNGRIYRYSNKPWRRVLSLGMLVIALAIATGIVAAACYLGVPEPLTVAFLPKMMEAWAAVLIGMGVHILVGSAKRSKTQNGMPSVLMDIILIIDARFVEIVMKVALGLIGLFGLLVISTSQMAPGATPDQMTQFTALNAFLVGYSLDSIIELFGTSMESTSQVKSLIKIK